ncbi:alpha/beta hydrolase [Mycobacterium sp. M1]|uniref:Alpha/beta hydrolase n=1 Tax=Mycolicibacter acidiphilus TaxID=2835306 RepID=A0ABS5RD66_9MYCO|nr:alpha/beta hydrolase [Mycolicibacter acidiphilus]MBS9532220.1 alpha/beta hydrolase [Mycolicibacter acidiphilus]
MAVPGRLLYLTEPARAVADFGLLAAGAPLLALLPRGDGHPVLVLPGLGSADSSTALLRSVLRRLGYRTFGWGLGRNDGPTGAATRGMAARLDELTGRFGVPISLIGWSLGGLYARQIARRRPADIRQVITLGTPVRLAAALTADRKPATEDLSDFPPWPHWSAWARWYGGLQGRDPDRTHPDAGPLPVPTTSIYSPLDGIVGWRICRTVAAPRTENIVVAASHLGFAHNPAVIFAIADRLAQPTGQWAPFRPPALLRAGYRSE